MFLHVRILSSRKHLRSPELNERPKTPSVYGEWPGSDRVWAHRSSFKRTHLHAPEPVAKFVTAGLSGYLPASNRVEANRSSFKRTHLRVLNLEQFPETPGLEIYAAPRSTAPWIVRNLPSRKQQVLVWPPDTPETPPVVAQFGYWPGSARVEANRSSFTRTHLRAPYPPEYEIAPGLTAPPLAAFDTSGPQFQTKKWEEVGAFLQRSTLSVFKETPPSYYTGDYPSAFPVVRAFKRRDIRRREQFLVPPELAPETPTTAAVIPSFFPPKQHRRHDRPKQLRKVTRLDSYPRTIQSPAAYAPVPTIKRRDTAKILQFPLPLDQYTQTPAVPEQPPTSFLMPVQHRRKGWSNIVLLAEFPDRQEAVFPTSREAVTTVWQWDLYRKKRA